MSEPRKLCFGVHFASLSLEKILGLPNFYIRNGKIYSRTSNGRFVSPNELLAKRTNSS